MLAENIYFIYYLIPLGGAALISFEQCSLMIFSTYMYTISERQWQNVMNNDRQKTSLH